MEGSLNQHSMMSSSRWAWISTLSSHPCLLTFSALPSLKLDFNVMTLKPHTVHSNSYLDVHFSSTLLKNRATENCNRWTIQKGGLYILLSITGLIANCAVAFKEYTNHSHQHLGAKYVKIPTKSAHEAFVKNEGMHFTQLSRLPYFDLVHGIVIDPMHNLILGEGLLIIAHHHIFTAPLTLIDYLSRTCQVTLLQYLGSMQNTLL